MLATARKTKKNPEIMNLRIEGYLYFNGNGRCFIIHNDKRLYIDDELLYKKGLSCPVRNDLGKIVSSDNKQYKAYSQQGELVYKSEDSYYLYLMIQGHVRKVLNLDLV